MIAEQRDDVDNNNNNDNDNGYFLMASSPESTFHRKEATNKIGVIIELGKINRLKALCMMQNTIWNIQTICAKTMTKHENKKHLQRSVAKKHYVNKQH